MAAYRDQLAQAINHFLPPAFFARFRVRKNQHWTPQRMLLVGLIMVWSEGQTLAARFEQAHETLKDLHRHWKLPGTYSGWVQATVGKSAGFLPQVTGRLREMVASDVRHGICALIPSWLKTAKMTLLSGRLSSTGPT